MTADYKYDDDDVNNGADVMRKVRILAVLTKDSDDSRNSEICFTKEAVLFFPAWPWFVSVSVKLSFVSLYHSNTNFDSKAAVDYFLLYINGLMNLFFPAEQQQNLWVDANLPG